jgi:hypothetical protein
MQIRKEKKQKYWRILRTVVLVVSLITFTPLVIPRGQIQPMLFGIPYTLWAGFVQTVVLVALTYLGTRVHPGLGEEEEVQV